MSSKKEELSIVTEVGVFGEMEINDPTVNKVKKKEDIDKLIEEAIESNLNNN